MNNNDILRRTRYAFSYNDDNMIKIFAKAEHTVTREEICNWLKRDEDEDFKEITDTELAIFLNGFINAKRGKKDGPQVEPEKCLTNNIILNKFKIALNLRSEDVQEIFELADFGMNKSELSGYFRKPNQRNYRDCRDQVLRNFIKGLQLRYRIEKDKE